MAKFSTDKDQLVKECEIEFFKAGGPGGQHRNKRDTAVRLFHRPSGITVTATERRSQIANLEVAYERLIKKLKALNFVKKARKKTRIPFGSKMKRKDNKRKHSQKKLSRKKPGADD